MDKSVTLPAVLTVPQTAEYLGVSEDTVYNLVHSEDFPSFRVGRSWRIDGQRLGEWVARQSMN